MKKKLIVVIVWNLIFIVEFTCIFEIYLRNNRLDVYSLSNDGRSITKAGNNYVFNAISNDKLRGKAIGKAEFNVEHHSTFLNFNLNFSPLFVGKICPIIYLLRGLLN